MVITRIGDIEIQGSEGAILLTGLLVVFSGVRLGAWGGLAATALLVASLLVHEIGHLAMAQALGVRVVAIGLCFKGSYLRRSESAHAWSELLIAGAGPVFSLFLYAWLREGAPVVRWVATLNLVLAISNLLPLPGSDGQRMLRATARLVRGHSVARPD